MRYEQYRPEVSEAVFRSIRDGMYLSLRGVLTSSDFTDLASLHAIVASDWIADLDPGQLIFFQSAGESNCQY
jgi:hypothetical protein